MSELHVVFGSGPLGKWTAHELLRLGKQVRVINRTGRADHLPESVDLFRAGTPTAGHSIISLRIEAERLPDARSLGDSRTIHQLLRSSGESA